MVTLRLRAWPVSPLLAAGDTVMMTVEVPAGVIFCKLLTGLLLPPQPERPAASAPVSNINQPSRSKPRCDLDNFRLRAKATNPAKPPGPHKASAGSIGYIGLSGLLASLAEAINVADLLPGVCSMEGSICNCATATFVWMVSTTEMAASLPVMVTVLLVLPPCVKTHFALDGRVAQFNVSVPLYPPTGVIVSVVVPVCPAAIVNEDGLAVME